MRDDYFAVLGLPRRYDLDAAVMEARYKELSRKLHPDRFAKADPRARRAALQRTVALNEAWRALKDPMKRAEYVLELGGVRLATDDKGARNGGVAAPPALLMEMLELREELGDARAAHDDAKVRRLGEAMSARAAQAKARVAQGLTEDLAGEGPTADVATSAARLEAVARELIALRYYQRFLDEVVAHADAAAARADGVTHG